jgi:hypothetical protein
MFIIPFLSSLARKNDVNVDVKCTALQIVDSRIPRFEASIMEWDAQEGLQI